MAVYRPGVCLLTKRLEVVTGAGCDDTVMGGGLVVPLVCLAGILSPSEAVVTVLADGVGQSALLID